MSLVAPARPSLWSNLSILIAPLPVNELMQCGFTFASPPVRNVAQFVDCLNTKGETDRLLLIDIEASEQVHRTHKHACFLRIGDETRLLNGPAERELEFDKGESIFDSSPAPQVELTDLDRVRLNDYAQLLQTQTERLLTARRLTISRGGKTCVTQAGWLLFSLNPPIRSYLRYLRYDGDTVETGTRSNLTKDRRIEGTISEILEQTQALLTEEIGEVIRLGVDGRFAPVPALPQFAWLEAVVNALTHRSYSAQGNGIHVRQFSNRLEIESPGRLPGLVRAQNIQSTRFSRNPHIARVLAETTSAVRELNEGVPRMVEEMRRVGLPEPKFSAYDTKLVVTLFKTPDQNTNQITADVELQLARLRVAFGRKGASSLMNLLKGIAEPRRVDGISTAEVMRSWKVSRVTAYRYLRALQEEKLLQYQSQSATDPNGRWSIIDSPTWKFVDLYQMPDTGEVG